MLSKCLTRHDTLSLAASRVQSLPVRFMIDRAGLVGNDGPTHHGCYDLAYLGTLPNIVVMAPVRCPSLQVRRVETARTLAILCECGAATARCAAQRRI